MVNMARSSVIIVCVFILGLHIEARTKPGKLTSVSKAAREPSWQPWGPGPAALPHQVCTLEAVTYQLISGRTHLVNMGQGLAGAAQGKGNRVVLDGRGGARRGRAPRGPGATGPTWSLQQEIHNPGGLAGLSVHAHSAT